VKARIIAFAALAVVLAALFVGLGFWQLARLAERRAANAEIKAALSRPAGPFGVPPSEGPMVNRYVVVEGVPDYQHEFVHTGRSRNGSPGVHIFTPVRLGGDTGVILVNRGWVYASDAATVDLTRWREARRTFRGYTRVFPVGGSATPTTNHRVRALNHQLLQQMLPYEVSLLYVVSRDSANDSTPARLPEPDISEGNHLSYAIQWFCFAAIALIGAGIVVKRAGSPGA
jgi:surfeit locus 1 family protein